MVNGQVPTAPRGCAAMPQACGIGKPAGAAGNHFGETDPARVAANICQTLKAPVSSALWKEYLPDIPYTPVCGRGDTA